MLVERVSGWIDVPIRRRDDEDPAGPEHGRQAVERDLRFADVLEHLEADDDVELTKVRRKVAEICGGETRAPGIRSRCRVDRVCVHVDPDHLGCALAREQLAPVARAATRVEDAFAFHQRPGPPVARQVLGLQEAAAHEVGIEPLDRLHRAHVGSYPSSASIGSTDPPITRRSAGGGRASSGRSIPRLRRSCGGCSRPRLATNATYFGVAPERPLVAAEIDRPALLVEREHGGDQITKVEQRHSLEAPQAAGMLADEAGDAAPVPERPAGEEALVGDGLVVVDHDRFGDVPPLPAGLARAVGEVDVLAVEPVALVEAAELVEQLAAEEEERAEQPVGERRLGRVARRAGSGCAGARCGLSRRRSGVRRTIVPPDRREAAARGLPAAVGVAELRAGDPAARVRVGELAERRDAAVGVASMSEFEATTNGAVVAATPRLMFAPKPSVARSRSRARRPVDGVAAGVGDEHELVHLRRERLEARPGSGSPGSRSRPRRRRSHELPVDGERSAGGLGPGEPRAPARGPAATSRSRSASARSIPPASSTGFRSATRIAASPATSGSAPAVVVTTGVPEAIASSTGRPNPS